MLEDRIQTIGPLQRGEYLFRIGDASRSLYIVQQGCFKACGVDTAGREYIVGFNLPATTLGLHGFHTGTHAFNAIALTESVVCRVTAIQLNELVSQIPDLLPTLLHLVGNELFSSIFLSGNFTAEERVTGFLVNFQDRLMDAGHVGDLYLPMSRSDIATYLHLALATVSRVLSRLERQGIIQSDYHHIRIVDQAHFADLCKDMPFKRMMSG